MAETTAFYSVSHGAAGLLSIVPTCPSWAPKPLGEGVHLPPAEQGKYKLQCRQTHLAFNLIFFTYLKSLNQKILLKKRIDQNAVIRSSKMIWSSSQSCSRLRIRSQGPFSSLANWITSHCNTKGSLFPSCQTHKWHAHFIDEEQVSRKHFPGIPRITHHSKNSHEVWVQWLSMIAE